MDYKYIEQLLERYWQCETTLQEEAILRTFFAQAEVPAHLAKFQPLFNSQSEDIANEPLGDDFDARILAMIKEPETVKARTVTLTTRLMPLFKAAAVVAIILTLGNAAQFSMQQPQQNDEINYADYKDTFDDPAMAYDNVEGALQLISEGFSQAQAADSLVLSPRTEADSMETE